MNFKWYSSLPLGTVVSLFCKSVSLVSFATITFCVAYQQVFNVISVRSVIDSVRKLLDSPSCSSPKRTCNVRSITGVVWEFCTNSSFHKLAFCGRQSLITVLVEMKSKYCNYYTLTGRSVFPKVRRIIPPFRTRHLSSVPLSNLTKFYPINRYQNTNPCHTRHLGAALYLRPKC